ncbi:Acyl-CoA N-acyltransferase [Penicillium malachiteum]|uniref:Acyl-CoA N-acyltransferase n=1 Tax=Penicillium malachiteum TaxID=1324776 RepID=UPI0025469FF6|nr:Acyl-CoA N-acyltransferase [Penicillium malachiteum]KAJ5726226.1 Acyl-CoA N-acyltransferase [Penicillium malachiteum]
MASNYEYSFFRISKIDGIDASAQKYRELRLQALKTSPGSFSSTYEIEAAFNHTDWVNRLTIPGREVFICAATPTDQDASRPSDIQWVGQVTLRGPASSADFELPAEAGQPPQRPDDEEERWQMLSLFTLPDHRGRGLGGKLCQASIDYLRSYKSFPRTVQVRLIVKAGNDVTVALYQRLGFIHAGKATLVEALIANGDEHLISKDGNETIHTVRQGLIMLSRVLRS